MSTNKEMMKNEIINKMNKGIYESGKSNIKLLTTQWYDANDLVSFERTDEHIRMYDAEGKELDSHYPDSTAKGAAEKCAHMLFRKYGWYGVTHTNDKDVAYTFIEKYWHIDDELAIEYLRWTKPTLPDNNWNYTLARHMAFSTYKKLRTAGFQQSFAAETAVNFEVINIDPNKLEIFDILGIKSKYE